MKIKFLWATDKVTGSKIYFEYNHKKILVDYGMEQEWENKANMYKNNLKLQFDPSEIDYIFLTHAHIDHSWLIPYLVKKGFNWKILMTEKTKDLLEPLWKDSSYIINKDWEYLIKKKWIKNLEVIYEEKDVKETLKKIITIDYKKPIYISKEWELIFDSKTISRMEEKDKKDYFVFYNSGHIVGSASIVFNFTNKKKERKSLCFSWDVWRSDSPLLINWDSLNQLTDLVLESTYWNKYHEPLEKQILKFEKVLEKGLKRWKVIIPSFSLDRTQTLIYLLKQIKEKGLIKDIPIYIDTPLWNKITKVYENSLEFFKNNIVHNILENWWKLFSFDWLKEIEEKEDSIRIISSKKPCIIIAASGMAENWRIIFHLEEELKNPETTILFVWYTIPWSLWYKIRNYKDLNIKEVIINKKTEQIKANIESISLSSHGDLKDLLKLVENNKKLKKIILNHGNYEAKVHFKELLENKYPKIEVIIAKSNFYYPFN